MIITAVHTYLAPLGNKKNWLFVKLETDEGISGWGEAYTQLDRELMVAQYIEQMSRYIIGRSPMNRKHFVRMAYDDFAWRRGSMELFCAISGIEQAMWDIVGKALNQPVYNLLGGACRPKIRIYANGWFWGAETLSDYAKAAEEVVKLGFTALKVYPLPGPTRSYVPKDHLKRAIQLVKTVRDAVGPEVDLLIDVCRRLVPMYSIELSTELAQFHPFWLEEPCSSENLDALAEIRNSSRIPVVTGEAIYTKERFNEVFLKRCADIINPDVCSVGGILPLLEIATMAEPHYIGVAPHNYNSTVLGLAATVQASAVMTNFVIAEYFVKSAVEGRKFARQLEPQEGYIYLPGEPGLGVDVNETALSKIGYKSLDKRSLPTYQEELI